MKPRKFDWLIVVLISYGFFLLLLDYTTATIFQSRDLARAAALWRGQIFFWGPETNGGGTLPGSFFYFLIGLPYLIFGHWLAVWHFMTLLFAVAVALLWRWWRQHGGEWPAMALLLFMLTSFVMMRSLNSFLNPSFLAVFEAAILLCWICSYSEVSENKKRMTFWFGALLLGLGVQIQFAVTYLALAVVSLQLVAPLMKIRPLSWRVFFGGVAISVLPLLPGLFTEWGLPRPLTYVDNLGAIQYYVVRYLKRAVSSVPFEWNGFHVFHQFFVLIVAILILMAIRRRINIFHWPSAIPRAALILPVFTFLWSLITGAAYLVGRWSHFYHQAYMTGFMVPILAAITVCCLPDERWQRNFFILLILLLAAVNLPSWYLAAAFVIAIAGFRWRVGVPVACILNVLGYIGFYQSYLSPQESGLPIWRDMKDVAKIVGPRPIFGIGIAGEFGYDLFFEKPSWDAAGGVLLVTAPPIRKVEELRQRPYLRKDVREMLFSSTWKVGEILNVGEISIVPYEVLDPINARLVSNRGLPYWDYGLGMENPLEEMAGERLPPLSIWGDPLDRSPVIFFIDKAEPKRWRISINGMGISQPSVGVLPRWTQIINAPYVEWICRGFSTKKVLAENLGHPAVAAGGVEGFEIAPFSQWVEVPCEKPEQITVGWESAVASQFMADLEIPLGGQKLEFFGVP